MHNYIYGTYGVITTPFCARSQAPVSGNLVETAPKVS